MPQTLSIRFGELKEQVARLLGWGLAAWKDDELKEGSVKSVVRQGLREFYYNSRHEWSFLKPIVILRAWAAASGTISGTPVVENDLVRVFAASRVFYPTMVGKWFTLDDDSAEHAIMEVLKPDPDPAVQDSNEILVSTLDRDGNAFDAADTETFSVPSDGNFDLPADFHSMNGRMTFGQNEGWISIQRTSEERIRRLRMGVAAAGQSYLSAVRPKDFDPKVGQRQELMLHPKPSANYSLSYSYTVLPNAAIDADNDGEYPRGGMAHAETILLSCQAKAELWKDQQPGAYAQQYQERLAASIRADLQTVPDTLGMGLDPGMERESDEYGRHLDEGTYVLYNGARTG